MFPCHQGDKVAAEVIGVDGFGLWAIKLIDGGNRRITRVKVRVTWH